MGAHTYKHKYTYTCTRSRTFTNIHAYTQIHSVREQTLMALPRLFAWHDGRMSSSLCNIAPILHWQAYIFFAVPNWLCSAELHLWIIWHISCYFFDRSTQRKFQGTFLLTSRNINIWINCRFGSPHMDALQQEREKERVCVFVSEWSQWEGFVSFCYHSLIPLSPQAQICMQHFIRRELGWVTCEAHLASTWWSLLLSNDKKPLCRLPFFSTEEDRGDGWAPIKESWMLLHKMTGLSAHKYFSSRKM